MEADTCIPFPAVQHWIEETNLSIEGGRCEGMAVLSQRINDEMNQPEDFASTATKTFDLPKPAVPVSGSISRWWATQMLAGVQEANARAQAMEPSTIAQNIARALRAKQGVTLGMYANGMGHAVTPIAVTWAEEGTIEILIYDNNYPGEITTVTIDDETETWTYDVGAANAGEAGAVWTGTTGSMDYTLMADREGEQLVPWSMDDRADEAKGSVRVTVTTGGRSIAGVVVTLGDKVVDSRDLASATEGIRIFPSRGGLGTGATVEIPAGLNGIKVKPVIGEVLDPAAGDIDLVFAVDSPGPGSIIVRDTVDPEDTSYDDFELELSTDDDYESNIDVAADGDIDTGYAFEEESIDVMLEDGQDLDIGDVSEDGAIDVSITDEAGAELYSIGFDGEADGEDLTTTELDIDEETGGVDATEVAVEAEDIDETILGLAAADATDDSDNSDNGPSSTDGGESSNSPDESQPSPTDNLVNNDAAQDGQPTDGDDSPASPAPGSDQGDDSPVPIPEAPADTGAGDEAEG